MKIKVEKKAWYGLCLLEEGELVDYEGDEVPVWGTLASGEEVAQDGKQPEEQNESTQQNESEGFKTPEGLTITVQNSEDSSDDVPPPAPDEEQPEEQNDNQPTPEEQNEFLEKLRDLAADNDVWVEQYPIAPEEEIAFLTEELKKKGINVVQEALEV